MKIKKKEVEYKFFNYLVFPAEYALPPELTGTIVTSHDEHAAAMKAMEPFAGVRRVSARKIGEGKLEDLAKLMGQYMDEDEPPKKQPDYTSDKEVNLENLAKYLKDNGYVVYKKKKI